MILRNVAIRHGRKALAGPLRISSIRSLMTESLSDPTTSSDLKPSIVDLNQVTSSSSSSSPPSELHLAQSLSSTGEANRRAQPRRVRESTSVRRKYKLQRFIKKNIGHLGSVLEPHYTPGQVIVDPPKPEDVTLELLMASQSHLGHSTSLWNPMNQRYIFGVRQGVHIISLETTAAHLRRAAKVVEGVAYHGGLILFVGTRPGQGPAVVKAAEVAKGCHLFEKWIPGSITNGDQILAKCEVKAVGINDEYIEGFEDKVADWKALKPDLVVCMNPLENYILLHECGLNNIPTIGVIDTDADPTWVTYPIPANDDSLRCIQVIAGVLGRAGEEGQRKRLAAAQTGESTWLPPQGLGKPYDEEEEKKKKQEAEMLAKAKSRAEERAKMSLEGGDIDPVEHEL
ncbi:uncharacterized protein L3040_003544 [Drepanopeziza brunnea f. sp. 'multigermtubi']|uniref:uncharacterized protein n=1 Tax=Drepanopeziza brunnea f. sp. 'multigermtubi' TaxID=698441 RepID=UPI00239B0AED|nr:hypothetical protein L3040_003544 [Drepanopeziza brunnea f. sp. 'multigermtubi']